MKRFLIYFIAIIAASSAFGQNNQKSYQGNRKFLLRDEGLSKVSFINLDDSTANWQVKVPAGRDLQLIGNGRVLIGTGNGYEELDIQSGRKLKEVTNYPGAVMARRLKNGGTLLVGLNWEDKKGIVLLELSPDGTKKKVLNFPEYDYVRLVRETKKGYLIPANKTVFESDAKGNIIWEAKLTGPQKTNSWQALRLRKGKTVVSAGYAGNFHPNFFSGFQVLSNGNYLVTNWQGHGPDYGKSGHQLLEFSPEGKLVWSWKQDASRFSSLQGVIALDGLNLKYLYIEGKKGKLKRVKLGK